jgi:hypothetical protein
MQSVIRFSLLCIALLVSCAQFSDAQHAGAQELQDDCGDPLPDTQDQFCASYRRSLPVLLNPYGKEHPDTLRERYATHSICAMCPCGIDPARPVSSTDDLDEVREFLATSPSNRLAAAMEAGDLRFLGVPDFVGTYIPCFRYRVMGDPDPDVIFVTPQTLNVQLSEEHAELNKSAYIYARQYNHLLVSRLICSDEIPLPEPTRHRLGIRCPK